MLERDAAAIGEELREERTELLGAAMDVLPAGRLAHVRVRLEGRDHAIDVACGERALVLADDIALMGAGVRLQ